MQRIGPPYRTVRILWYDHPVLRRLATGAVVVLATVLVLPRAWGVVTSLVGTGGCDIPWSQPAERGELRGMWAVKVDGSGARQVSSEVLGEPAWSPDRSLIAFSSAEGGLYAMRPDGSEKRVLIPDPVYRPDNRGSELPGTWTGERTNSPSWSPDGQRVVFVGEDHGRGTRIVTWNPAVSPGPDVELYVVNLDETGRVQLTDDDRHQGWPAWSPDGAQIAFTTLNDNGNVLEIMNIDGSGRRTLVDGEPFTRYPRWSPDGTTIVYAASRPESTRHPDGQGWIGAVYLDGRAERGLTGRDCYDSHPAWSPDGSQIAFDTRDEGGGIAVIEADGTGRRQLTEGTTDFEPIWSADGHEIYFFRTG